MDMRSDGTGLCEDENRYGRFNEYSRIGRVQDYKVLLQNRFDMAEIKKEEAAYVPLPKFYTFKSREERERILYKTSYKWGKM